MELAESFPREHVYTELCLKVLLPKSESAHRSHWDLLAGWMVLSVVFVCLAAVGLLEGHSLSNTVLENVR